MKLVLWPLVMIWLAAHALLLAIILGVKFLTLKIMALLFLAGTAFRFLLGRRKTLALPAPPSMV